MKRVSVTVGIPTHEAGESLVAAVNSVVAQTAYEYIDSIVVAVDGNKVAKEIVKQLNNDKVKIVRYKKRAGQSERINNIIKITSSDLLVLTNDDVELDSNAIKAIVNAYRRKEFDLAAAQVIPHKFSSLFSKIISKGVEINKSVSSLWNKSNNYLSCNGRLIVLSKTMRKSLLIPRDIKNNDAYIFLYCKIHRMKYIFLNNVKCYYIPPRNLREHIRQSSKFQFSLIENQQYFKENIVSYYNVPLLIRIRALVASLLKDPITTSEYLFVFSFSRLIAGRYEGRYERSGIWETDKSTKKI